MRTGSVAALALLVGWLALAALASHPPPRVPAAGTVPSPKSALGSREAASTSALIAMREGRPIDLNAATIADLELLPGVGPRLAQRIIDARTERGGFGSIADLQAVSGIGPAKLERIAGAACAGQGCAQRSSVSTTDSVLTK